MNRPERILTVNAAMQCFAADTRVELRSGRVYVCWRTHSGEEMARPWACRGQSCYPVWYRHWAHGGTCCTALAQLVRWLRDQPVLPLSTWRYWCTPTVLLARDRGQDLLSVLHSGGYPDEARCCLCDERVSSFDWWSLDGVSGPCCNHNEGCRQKGNVVA